MPSEFRKCIFLFLLASLAACASSANNPSGNPPEEARVLTAEQIRSASGSNAFDVVRTLRPAWLRKRGSQSLIADGNIVVYYDNVRLGGPESLRSLATDGVLRMEFLDGASATQRWGTGHNYGAIVVVGRR